VNITATQTWPAAALAGLLALAPATGRGAQSAPPRSGLAPATASATAPFRESSRAAVEEALRDELRGEAIYARVLKDHGEVRPFSNVIRAERRHAAFLADLLKARSLAVPALPAGDEVPGYASVKEACAAAVVFETKNVALYDRLLAAGPLQDDVKQAFDHNRMASLDHHKPAFERCAGVVSAQGAGRGPGHGAGHGAGRLAGCGNGCGQGCGTCGHGPGHGRHGCGPS
jgi:hypothetical protein